MKSIIFFMCLLLWAGCDNSTMEVDGEVIETRARIVNNLAVDGCDWHFEVATVDSIDIVTLVPTLASEPRVKEAVPKWGTQDAYSFIDVNIKYRPTDQERSLTCGFGNTAQVDAIEVLEISKVK
ncbi:MAG: hypothetical protein KKG00_11415 [Bacteroidetes bacterium]|nr:hypothetical protein [Bacteroidota bacterium]